MAKLNYSIKLADIVEDLDKLIDYINALEDVVKESQIMSDNAQYLKDDLNHKRQVFYGSGHGIQ